EVTVKINAVEFFFQRTLLTDDEGRAELVNIPAGRYIITAEKQFSNLLIFGQKQKSLLNDPALNDTIKMGFVPTTPLVMNEIYYSGCKASAFYYYDQFIELYNSSDETIYLDGYIFGRGTHYDNLLDWEAVDYAIAYYIYKFPGERGVTRDHPIEAGEFLVIACDAIDHSAQDPACVDHSDAVYEFCNPQEFDWCPAEIQLFPVTEEGKDFTMNLGHESVFLATGEEYSFHEHINDYGTQVYGHVPLETIIDAVEYASNPDASRYMTERLDASLAPGAPKYGARSIERRFPGLDSNNSAFDFIVTDKPTPGYHH
ncbi:MAG: DUF4876 domain-containing protein, partial [Candidatus Latescibacteria bacterium]|nr:DUF4876 domain-containing protein [bacterium]MBD3424768.1 DUF4876 domain-containing protein [Candidatus Latescibacterota bacterium]